MKLANMGSSSRRGLYQNVEKTEEEPPHLNTVLLTKEFYLALGTDTHNEKFETLDTDDIFKIQENMVLVNKQFD